MKITYRGDYALKAVLDLASNYGRELVTIHEIASRIDAPIKFLEQILLDLKKGGFVESKRGKIGGYQLARTPDSITVGEVVRFMDGSIEPISCVKDGYSACGDTYKCVFRKIWQDVDNATRDIVDNITFLDLINKVHSSHEELTYCI